MEHSVYITGTDTGIGKTTVSCSLLHALRSRGLRAIGMKPVASGCEGTPEGWRNDDALRLIAASDPQPDYALCNPFAFPDPTAPELAAGDVGAEVRLPLIRGAFSALATQADFVVVEGVGGWMAPLSARLDQSELPRVLELPVILVVGLRLGCINHSRLSARAIQADGLRLLGWIGNAVDPEFHRCEETIAILDRVIAVPRLGLLSHRTNALDATVHSIDWADDRHLTDFWHGADSDR